MCWYFHFLHKCFGYFKLLELDQMMVQSRKVGRSKHFSKTHLLFDFYYFTLLSYTSLFCDFLKATLWSWKLTDKVAHPRTTSSCDLDGQIAFLKISKFFFNTLWRLYLLEHFFIILFLLFFIYFVLTRGTGLL